MYALIPAAGRGVRFSRIGANGERENKVFAPLLDRPLLGWTLQAFADCVAVDRIILIGSEADLPRLREIGERYGGGKLASVVLGGETRQESVRLGLEAIQAETAKSVYNHASLVVVHDAARCCVTPKLITQNFLKLGEAGKSHRGPMAAAVTAAVPVSDTVVRSQVGGTYDEVVPREPLYLIQTPQVFDYSTLQHTHDMAAESGARATDDAGLVADYLRAFETDPLAGVKVHLGPGSPENIKVTRPEDLALAAAILSRRVEAASGVLMMPLASSYPIRVGHGYDVHPFAEGRPLWLGGVHFPESPVGLLGHSDADALLHAVCDALLGAAGIGGDIGALFPPSDARHKDRPSIEFLAEVMSRIRDAGWRVGNVDVSVLAEFPKIGPRAGDIRRVIAVCLRISADAVSVKATTNEKMGFVGRGEGIAVHATVLIHR